MSQFLNSINEVKKNYSKYDDWEQKQADEKAQKLYIAKTLDIPKDKLELTEEKAKTVIRAAELLDNRSENNAENMEQLTGILSSIAILIPAFGSELLLMQMMKKGKKIPKGLQFASPVLTLATAVGLILWGNAKQKEASRIGRFQAKQNELKDVKNFVIYTPEQIERAVEKAKEIPDEKERKGLMKLIAEMKEIEDVSWDNCKITKNDSNYENTKESLDGLRKIVSTAIAIILIISVILIVLILNLWTKHRTNEVGILLSIGISKKDLIWQQIVEVLIISVPAFILSFVTSSIATKVIGSKLINSISSSIDITVNIHDWLIVSGIGLLIILISTIISIYQITKIKPRDIFSKID